MSRAILSGLMLLFALSDSTAGHAAKKKGASSQRVGVVPLSANGDGALPVAAGVTRGIVAGLRKQRREVKLLDDADPEKLRLCTQQPSCVRALSTKYGVSMFLTGHVEALEKGFQLDIRVLSGQSGEVAATEDLQIASAREDRQAVRLAQRLLEQAKSGAAVVKPPAPDQPPPDDEGATGKGDGENPLAVQKKAPTVPGQPGRPGDAEQPIRPRPPKSFGARYWPSLATGALGLASFGVAAAFGVMCKNDQDQGRKTTDQKEASGLLDSARQNALVANILFGVGGAALAASAVLLIFEIRDARLEKQALRTARPLQLQLGLAAGGATIFARGEF